MNSNDEIVNKLNEILILINRKKYENALSMIGETLVKNFGNEDPKFKSTLPAIYTYQGLCFKSLNKKKEALESFTMVINLDPTNWQAYTNKGTICRELMLITEAFDFFMKAIELETIENTTNHVTPLVDPVKENMAILLSEWSMRLKQAGDNVNAIKKSEEALTFNPNCHQALFIIGTIAIEGGDMKKSEEYYEKVLQIIPSHVDALCNMGVIYKSSGQLQKALQYFEKAYSINPNFTIVADNMATTICDVASMMRAKKENIQECMKMYERALTYNPKYSIPWYNLGVIYYELKEYDKATIYFNMTIHFNDKCAEAFNNLGVVSKDKGNIEMALKYYEMAIKVNPKFTQGYNNLSVTYNLVGHFEESYKYAKEALLLDPTQADMYNNYGVTMRDEGFIKEAIEQYNLALKYNGKLLSAGQNKMLALNYLTDISLDELFTIHENWGKHFESFTKPIKEWSNNRNPNRQLKIGYISPDYFTHSVSYFIEAILKNSNISKTYNICYANVLHPDERTNKLKLYVPLWRDIVDISAEKIAEMIKSDEIDILIDLAGHTAGNRLDVLALHPAPIQISWIGYPNTSGFSSMNYHIVDSITDPIETKQRYTEKLIRMPNCFLCYTPPVDMPPILQTPAMKNGFITFGSFNNIAKIHNPLVLDTWCKILAKHPNSRLLLKSKPFAGESTKKLIFDEFEKRGISSGRIDLLSLFYSNKEHLNTYAMIDISLDTFPYTGTTTTCESLIMGVPVITLKGDRHVHNVSASILTNVGLNEYITNTQEEYIDAALRLASDINKLNEIHLAQRDKMIASNFCNGPKFTNEFTEKLLKVWEDYCVTSS